MENKKIVVIGGGTGTVGILQGLKQRKELDVSVIVSMTDDGGSNRVVRDDFGLLPLSDLRKSIIALAGRGNGKFRDLFTYRFDKGDGLSGHTLGNLIMMAMSDITGSEEGAVEYASRLFDVEGEIIPVTYDLVKLTVEYENGNIVQGEHLIDEPANIDANEKIKRLFVSPKATANPKAIGAISEADVIIAGPGDLYTSTIANMVVDGIPEAIQASNAKYIFVGNLMTKTGQTHWMKASDLVDEISKYSTRTPDIVIENNGIIPEEILEKYTEANEFPIEDDLTEDDYKVIRADIIPEVETERQQGDTLVRSLIRHDSDKLSNLLFELINESN